MPPVAQSSIRAGQPVARRQPKGRIEAAGALPLNTPAPATAPAVATKAAALDPAEAQALDAAASKVQAATRGRAARKAHQKRQANRRNQGYALRKAPARPSTELDNAAAKVQAATRGRAARKARKEQDSAAAKLQAATRGRAARKAHREREANRTHQRFALRKSPGRPSSAVRPSNVPDESFLSQSTKARTTASVAFAPFGEPGSSKRVDWHALAAVLPIGDKSAARRDVLWREAGLKLDVVHPNTMPLADVDLLVTSALGVHLHSSKSVVRRSFAAVRRRAVDAYSLPADRLEQRELEALFVRMAQYYDLYPWYSVCTACYHLAKWSVYLRYTSCVCYS